MLWPWMVRTKFLDNPPCPSHTHTHTSRPCNAYTHPLLHRGGAQSQARRRASTPQPTSRTTLPPGPYTPLLAWLALQVFRPLLCKGKRSPSQDGAKCKDGACFAPEFSCAPSVVGSQRIADDLLLS